MKKYISILLAAAVIASLSGCAASDGMVFDVLQPAAGGASADNGGASADNGGASADGGEPSGGTEINSAYTPTDVGAPSSTRAPSGGHDVTAPTTAPATAAAAGADTAGEAAPEAAVGSHSYSIADMDTGYSEGADSGYSYSDIGGTDKSATYGDYEEYDGAYAMDAPMAAADALTAPSGAAVDDCYPELPMEDEDIAVEFPTGDEDWVNITPQAGLLTGGEWNDNDHWNDWVSLYQSHEDWGGYKEQWQISFDSRCEVTVTSGGVPVEGAKVSCPDVGSAVTDNTGRAYLFFDRTALAQDAGYEITAEYDGISASVPADLSGNKTAEIELEGAEKRSSKKLDLMIMCDTTGSMMDELRYLQEELEDVVTRVKKDNANLPIRLSVNFYRDEGDEYIVREFPFTENLDDVVKAIRAQEADGGGDFPEAVHTALNSAINSHDWNEDAVKIMFLVLDAPPHSDTQIVGQVNSLVKQAAEKGIRIIPVASSGIDKSTEYLLRTMAFVTGGTYTFLTDDSGIGFGHIEPTIGDYAVEKLNDMMVRIVNRYLADDPEEFAAPAPEPRPKPAQGQQ